MKKLFLILLMVSTFGLSTGVWAAEIAAKSATAVTPDGFYEVVTLQQLWDNPKDFHGHNIYLEAWLRGAEAEKPKGNKPSGAVRKLVIGVGSISLDVLMNSGIPLQGEVIGRPFILWGEFVLGDEENTHLKAHWLMMDWEKMKEIR